VLSWALYDWANSAFALVVITAFVPVMLAGYWSGGAPSPLTTFRLGMANGIASIIVVVLAPLLGALTDRSGRRKLVLGLATAIGVLATEGLAIVGEGGWLPALALFAIASVGFFSANSLYDAMLIDVAAPGQYDRVSAWGYALGYLGGALLFLLGVAMLLDPGWFGLPGETAALQLSFLLVAAWWTVFSLPLLLFVRERSGDARLPEVAIAASFRQVIASLRALRGQRNLLFFLAAYWLYIDGVYTIIKMAVDYGLSQGLSARDVTTAILLTNFIGFPAAIAFGRIGEWIGPKRGIVIALLVYVVATAAAVFLTTAVEFYALAVSIGMVQGGVQSLSRSLYARLVPAAQRGEYFGFYNMLGKFSSILGPMLAGSLALLAGSQRVGILSIVVLFVAGLWLLSRVQVPAAAGTH
jgi:UMF1 family MFS transporter